MDWRVGKLVAIKWRRPVLTNSGQLVPTPFPPIPGVDQVVYAGTVYGAGLNVTPVHRMVINVNWFRVYNADTVEPADVELASYLQQRQRPSVWTVTVQCSKADCAGNLLAS